MACDEHLMAEACRVAGCKWDKPTATCDDWPLQNSNMGKPTPPKIPETLSPTPLVTVDPTMPVPTPAAHTPGMAANTIKMLFGAALLTVVLSGIGLALVMPPPASASALAAQSCPASARPT